MKFAISTLLCVVVLGCSSSKTPFTDETTSGTLNGAFAGTVTGATLHALQNDGDDFTLTIAASTSDSSPDFSLLTSPDVNLNSADLQVDLSFTSVPTLGTYDAAQAGGQSFLAQLTVDEGNGVTGTYAAGTASTDPTAALTVTFTSVTKSASNVSQDIYTVHGSIDGTLPGSIAGTSGPISGTETLHLDF